MQSTAIRITAIMFLLSYNGFHRFVHALRITKPQQRKKPTILLTGTFASSNWLSAHLGPLAKSNAFSKILVVATAHEYEEPNVEWIVPPALLTRLTGKTASRLITFFVISIRYRPDWIAGFHLLFNGLIATLIARLLNRRSMHFCVGGPAEVAGGGIQSENRFFEKIGAPSEMIENLLLRASGYADAVIFMGSTAKRFYVQHGFKGRATVIPGGIEVQHRDIPPFAKRDIDALFVGRLSKIKDLPLYLKTIAKAKGLNPSIKGVIVGDGEERQHLECEATALGLDEVVQFVGYQHNVKDWLFRSKVLVLTSLSEGLSLAVMEAMGSGVPVVAPDVGDLRDAVLNNQTGLLINSRNPDDYSSAILSITTDISTFDRLSNSARELATHFSVEATAAKWSAFVSDTNR